MVDFRDHKFFRAHTLIDDTSILPIGLFSSINFCYKMFLEYIGISYIFFPIFGYR